MPGHLAHSTSDAPARVTALRTLLALAVVFVMLATTGWTAVHRPESGVAPRAAALAAWATARVDGRIVPPADAPVRTVARFFAELDGHQRTRLADAYPLVVGNLDGVPAALRYRANRASLEHARLVELARAEDIALTPADRDTAGRRAHRFAALAEAGRQILVFDPTGGGLVAEVFGDLDAADRVSVIVPGADTDALTFERTQRRLTAPAGMAASLYGAERAAAPGERTAVIAWAGYTAPTGVGVDAATGRLAVQGAARLESLAAALPGDASVALFCHSYGSVVCGVAARRLPDRVTDLVVAGSPGMRADNTAELGTSARVWAMRDEGDWIADVPHLELGGLGHGADPVSPEFGARLLSSTGAKSHTGYFEPGTASLDNFARIGTGAFSSVACADGGDACRREISTADGR
ncbi:alpha/beta hydrolase [Streptomyces sp. RerS4]|uniref:alpha/beta hydrolase n=1 Tax=Streptomyces sp. RerS4 TaxID=2942449 RepID=UPI00201C4D10|nr:alpha/beta hydrolase [Streptomyces sp. RerS4]UQX04959.1 alpha/beta hydrolase family protein [Streptomyces sp. RerS4]